MMDTAKSRVLKGIYRTCRDIGEYLRDENELF